MIAGGVCEHFEPGRYLAEVPLERLVVRDTHYGEPVPKQRPRLGRNGRVYTPGSTKDHQRELADLVRSRLVGAEPDGEWAYGIRAVFYVQTHQRKDVDNMLKTVLDAMNRLIFCDDSQVKELMGWSVYDGESPRTEFVVYRLHPICRESGTCNVCGKRFRLYKSWRMRVYCSRKCYMVSTMRSAAFNCTHCGREFIRKRSVEKKSKTGDHFCSVACKGKHSRRRAKCDVCGNAINRPNSWSRPGQVKNYCSQVCYHAGPKPSRVKPLTTEELRAIAKKGWETRRKADSK